MSAATGKSMSVLEHLAELRSTLLWALGLAAAAAVVTWFFSDTIVDALLRPAHEAGQETLYFTEPMEAFLLKLKASAVVGLLLVFPLILYKVYGFVLPGLLPREKRVVTPMLVAATGLFYVGVAFCFVVLLPLVIRFAVGFATESLQPWLTAGAYFALAARLCLAFGLLFELPMVVLALTWVGLVQPMTLLRGWRYALVLILIAAALLTPPDIISQVLLAGPVMLLYLGSVLVSMLVRRRKQKDQDDENEDEDGPGGGPGGGGGGPAGGAPPSPEGRSATAEPSPSAVDDAGRRSAEASPDAGAGTTSDDESQKTSSRPGPQAVPPGPEMGQPLARDGVGGSGTPEEN